MSHSKTALLEFREVSCRYDAKVRISALEDSSFRIEYGEQLCISGSSGTGKTTLLNLAGGLQDPSQGSVLFQGKAWNKMSSREKSAIRASDIGFVFQSPNLIPVMTARQNVEFALTLAMPKLSKSDRSARVDQALDLVGLASRKHEVPAKLSGGECQRTAIARAIAKRPILLIADEPTSNLDDENAHRVQQLFEFIGDQFGSALLVATHDNRISRHYKTQMRLTPTKADETFLNLA